MRAIIMAGFDYTGAGVDFALLARNRRARLIKARPDITVTILDVTAGTATVSAVERDSQGKPVRIATSRQSHRAVTAANYSSGLGEGARFDTHPEGRMSIVDLYAAVRAVGAGKATKGTLLEVSIFSHAFWEGPILVNSDDRRGNGRRDPSDKDGRVGKDFKRENMSAAHLAEFRAAFASRGTWWNWGCLAAGAYLQVVHQFINSPAYRKAPAGQLKDTDRVRFSFSQAWAEEHYGDDDLFFPQATRAMTRGQAVFKHLDFERTVKQVKDMLRRGVRACYHSAVANASGVPVCGALLGTYASFEDRDPRIKLPLMLVPRSKRFWNDDFTRHVAMWVKHMSFAEDPERHGYGVYRPVKPR